ARLPCAQHRGAEDVAIEGDRALYVSNDEGIGHHELELSILICRGHHDRLFVEGGCSKASRKMSSAESARMNRILSLTSAGTSSRSASFRRGRITRSIRAR